VVRPEIARQLKRPLVKVIGTGETMRAQIGGKVDLT
jgi:acetyl-CoA C-acetyltransferase